MEVQSGFPVTKQIVYSLMEGCSARPSCWARLMHSTRPAEFASESWALTHPYPTHMQSAVPSTITLQTRSTEHTWKWDMTCFTTKQQPSHSLSYHLFDMNYWI